MRFGWLAAAAAMVCAGQAGAVNWVKYEISGTGTQTASSRNSAMPVAGMADFRLYVTVDTDAGGYSGSVPLGAINYSSTGSIFTARYLYGNNYPGLGSLTVDGANTGRLTGSYSAVSDVSVTENFSFSLNYADNDVNGGLPMAVAGRAASGTLSYFFGSGGGTLRIDGTVTGLTVFGQAAAYATPTIDAVPEPASWAMMIVGVGAIGAMARRRRRGMGQLTTA